MKYLTIILAFIALHGFSQDNSPKFKYEIGVEGIVTAASAKSMIDPIREIIQNKIVRFDETELVFKFESTGDISEAKFAEFFTSYGYTLIYYKKELITEIIKNTNY